MLSFQHAGDAGDIIYSLPYIFLVIVLVSIA